MAAMQGTYAVAAGNLNLGFFFTLFFFDCDRFPSCAMGELLTRLVISRLVRMWRPAGDRFPSSVLVKPTTTVNLPSECRVQPST